jgi:predicted nucleic acid-binding Zn ribbon protein
MPHDTTPSFANGRSPVLDYDEQQLFSLVAAARTHVCPPIAEQPAKPPAQGGPLPKRARLQGQTAGCPGCGGPLELYDDEGPNKDKRGTGFCHACGKRWPLTEALPQVDRRGLKCKVCGEPVVYPRYYYCSDECKALKRPERQRVNSREYRKRKREEAEQQQEARRARSRRQDSDKL